MAGAYGEHRDGADRGRRALRTERHLRILEFVSEHGGADVTALAAWLEVSGATVRRDLQHLHDQRLLQRTHGGAVTGDAGAELPLRSRAERFHAEKRDIARAAAELVPEGAVVGLTGGTTTTEIARLLARRGPVTIVTNAVNIAAEMVPHPQVGVVVTGGQARSRTWELVGPGAERMLADYHTDITFLGVDGIGVDRGCTTHDPLEAATDRAFLAGTAEAVVVADRSKIGKATFARICPVDAVRRLITDAAQDHEELARMRGRGILVTSTGPLRDGRPVEAGPGGH
ncbi:DeoR/GlpR family DNA-binding transcription regulator [Streptomyces sp. NPDC058698]|uniref:DeoR/GlpR family DNA-binding transcription regulator n=1 Tax=Streptomyces sp. NPDC058698 TaxID=3346606 RepID=UPI003659806F